MDGLPTSSSETANLKFMAAADITGRSTCLSRSLHAAYATAQVLPATAKASAKFRGQPCFNCMPMRFGNRSHKSDLSEIKCWAGLLLTVSSATNLTAFFP